MIGLVRLIVSPLWLAFGVINLISHHAFHWLDGIGRRPESEIPRTRRRGI